MVTYKYTWHNRWVTFFTNLSLFSVYHSLCIQIIVKIAFKSASCIKQFESSFFFTKRIYHTVRPWKYRLSLGKSCGLHYLGVQTRWVFLTILSVVLQISQKVKQMNSWQSSNKNWSSAYAENCTTYYRVDNFWRVLLNGKKLLFSSRKICNMKREHRCQSMISRAAHSWTFVDLDVTFKAEVTTASSVLWTLIKLGTAHTWLTNFLWPNNSCYVVTVLVILCRLDQQRLKISCPLGIVNKCHKEECSTFSCFIKK